MRLTVLHKTHYAYDMPVPYGLQQLRLMPKNSRGQAVLNWETSVEGGKKELSYTDENRNHVELISFKPGSQEIIVTCKGEVDLTLEDGIVGKHMGFAPLWYFKRETDLTTAGSVLKKLAAKNVKEHDTDIARLHALSKAIAAQVKFEVGATNIETKAEDAYALGKGVCQDHTHIFLACARSAGYPARYVAGYLLLADRVEQDASHAWAEVYIEGIGWTGFDVANGISPDDKYIRVATGLDYRQAAPISGLRHGSGNETLDVSIQVQQ